MENFGIIHKPELTNSCIKEQILVVGQVQSGKTAYIIEKVNDALLKYNYDCAIIIGGVTNILLAQTVKRFQESKEISLYEISDTYNLRTQIPKNKFVISTLKSSKQLENTYKFLFDDISNLKILIVDDESDYFSQNNVKNPSTIYNTIIRIYKSAKACTLMSVTATPYADILVKNSFTHSAIHIIPAPEEYTGIDFFQNSSILTECNIDNFLTKEFWQEKINDHIKRVLDSNIDKTQFLIMVDNVSNHRLLFNLILDILKKYIENIRTIHVTFFKEYNIEELHKVLVEMQSYIVIIDGDAEFQNNKNSSHKSVNWQSGHSIIIGGRCVSRGVTFKKLITAIVLDEPTSEMSADVLLQKARWFGYRKKENLCQFMKVYLSEKMIKAYDECKILNDFIFNSETIEEIRDKIQNYNFKYIKPTGKNKNE